MINKLIYSRSKFYHIYLMIVRSSRTFKWSIDCWVCWIWSQACSWMVTRKREISLNIFHHFLFSQYFLLCIFTYEPRRHASVLVLKELAQNSPTLFYVHVSAFVEFIWVTLRDPKVLLYNYYYSPYPSLFNLRYSNWYYLV